MAIQTYNLGPVTAYGDAKAGGYTGTLAEWQALMANYATVSQQAAQSAQTASTKATEASNSAEIALDAQARAEQAAESLVLDTTLTQSGKAADAKATGDKISEITEDLTDLESGLNGVALKYGYSKNINEESLWQQGMINSTTGINSPSTAGQHNYRIRTTDYISNDVQAVTATGDGYVQMYKYNQDGTFAELIPFTKQVVLIDNRYKYRVVYAKRITSNVAVNPTDDYGNVALLNTLLIHDAKHSAFYRHFTFGNVGGLNGYYQGKGSDYSLFNRSTMSSEVYEKFDALMTNNTDYITKTDLGASSNSDHLFAYDFCPKHVNNANPMPKIIIISAQHGFEKVSTFGLYYLMRDICQSWSESSILEYIRHHVELIVVPVINRHGFDAVVYKNANGVNLNRNYDTPEFVVGDDPTASSYGGASPFDQPETQIVRDLVKANPDAMALIDWHNTGGGKVTNYTDINWLSITNFDKDPFLAKTIDAGAYHISNITAYMPDDYNLPVGTSMCGYMTIDEVAERPTAGRWARYARNMFGMTFETPCGFPNEESAFSQDVQKANSELMGNWLASLLSIYAQEG